MKCCLKLLLTSAACSKSISSTISTCVLKSVLLYLQGHLRIFDPDFVSAVKTAYLEKQNSIIHEISFLHFEVVDVLKELNISHQIEKRFYGLDIDILLTAPGSSDIIGVLEIHGYQHYLRNIQCLTGDSYLKQQILEGIVGKEGYFVIELQSWQMLAKSDRIAFVSDLLRPLLSKLSSKA